MGGEHGLVDHHHHKAPYVVPNHEIYKIENYPKLVKLQKELAKKGLKDPWMRNYAWRFDETHMKTASYRAMVAVFRGLPYGLAAFVATVGIDALLNKNGGSHEHSEGHH